MVLFSIYLSNLLIILFNKLCLISQLSFQPDLCKIKFGCQTKCREIKVFSKKDKLMVNIPNSKSNVLEIEMSGQFFGRLTTLVEEVLTYAPAPQEYHKVC